MRPTIRQLALKVETLETRRSSKRNRETLEIAGFEPVLLAPGLTAAEMYDLLLRIYGSEQSSSSVMHEGRPAGASSTPGRAAAVDPAGPEDDRPRLTAGQRAIRRVELQRRRQRLVTR